MTAIHAEAAAVIPAPAEQIYNILADYRHAHPAILPRPYFEELVVEEGGQGAGTVFRLRMKVLGTVRTFHEIVTEPVAGRVLVETDFSTGQSSTFTLEPLADGQSTRVTIATDFQSSRGFAGLLEQLLNPPITRRIFRQELQLLADYVQAQAIWQSEAG